MKAHFLSLARYNRWANARLQTAADALDDTTYRRPVGIFFGSIHRTLNHILLTDRIWLSRLTGEQPETGPLDRILHEDRAALAAARAAEDARIVATVEGWTEVAFAALFTYHNMAGEPFTQPLTEILAHIFNHQTHHRGQMHAALQIVTDAPPPSLDMIMFQREAAD